MLEALPDFSDKALVAGRKAVHRQAAVPVKQPVWQSYQSPCLTLAARASVRLPAAPHFATAAAGRAVHYRTAPVRRPVSRVPASKPVQSALGSVTTMTNSTTKTSMTTIWTTTRMMTTRVMTNPMKAELRRTRVRGHRFGVRRPLRMKADSR